MPPNAGRALLAPSELARACGRVATRAAEGDPEGRAVEEPNAVPKTKNVYCTNNKVVFCVFRIRSLCLHLQQQCTFTSTAAAMRAFSTVVQGNQTEQYDE